MREEEKLKRDKEVKKAILVAQKDDDKREMSQTKSSKFGNSA